MSHIYPRCGAERLSFFTALKQNIGTEVNNPKQIHYGLIFWSIIGIKQGLMSLFCFQEIMNLAVLTDIARSLI
jgi:hypothetical protein